MPTLVTAVAFGFIGSVLLVFTRDPDLADAVRVAGAVGPAALAFLFLVNLPSGPARRLVPLAGVLAVGGVPVAVLGHLLAPDPHAVVVLPVAWAVLVTACLLGAVLTRRLLGRTREEVSS